MNEKTEKNTEMKPVRPEIIIGLVGAVGVDFDFITRALKEKLKTIGYKTNYIKLSDQIKEFNPYIPDSKIKINEKPEYKRVENLMDAGDNIRAFSGRGDAVVLLALLKLSEMRKKDERPNFNTVSILKSLKHPEEVYTLRRIYGPGFFLIGIHSSREKRKKALSKKIARSQSNSRKQREYYSFAEKLMNRDEKGKTDFGQDGSGTFHLSDFFVSLDDEKRAKKDIERFIELIFENPHITPTKDEYSMFVAYAASLKSGDLSRQVGAAISNKQGDILSTGTNDVPSPEGGLYWEDSEKRDRDFERGGDSNKEEINNMIEGIENKLIKELGEKLRNADLREILRNTDIKNITEFGRSVHAEMDALTQAARLGTSIKNATLFTTLFPCHNCTKHIIASGIKRVVYIEPYLKSLATQLHEDAITVDEAKAGKVRFEPFIGVSPNRFSDLFSVKRRTGKELKRKDDKTGKVIEWQRDKSWPRIPLVATTYLDLEMVGLKVLIDIFEGKKKIEKKKKNK
ncbi:MAG: anti-phage dCTP deaminase [Candidatus Aminicenantes bacterium]|jgi:deoxycytidylate deaminase